MSRWLTGTLMLAFGLGLLRVGIDGSYSAWVTMHPAVVITVGVVMALFGVMDLVGRANHAGHDGHRITPWALGLIVTVVAVLTPAALLPAQVDVANRAAAVGSGSPASWPDLPVQPVEIGLREVVARSATAADGRLQGRQVIVTGQLEREGQIARLGRVTVTCCAADARAYFVELNDSTGRLSEIPDGAWVSATVVLIPGSGTADRDFVPRVGVVDAREVGDAGYDVARLA
ncbi:hypothetical protein [Corynebacterium amycolatum]|uniref:hypothetical protein n=1 Tax=Corynebacterium amycolatum TaxID=43765 RepID=UPI00117AE8B5|nr:hypothetical protein [Corynebacterium amycolatum]MDK7316368.1 hypothetical protein [Corynebacterium amycolatum]